MLARSMLDVDAAVLPASFPTVAFPMNPTDRIDHRPWPLPSGPWVMAQTWHDLLFAHWPVETGALRRLIPRDLPLDTFEGRCWVGIAPFHMSHIHARGLPPLPGLSRFPELNVRTYVTLNGKPGVYFFSLDATSRPAVWAARRFYCLPYFYASMSVVARDGWINYDSRRRSGKAEFRGRFHAISEPRLHEKVSLEN